MEEKTTIEEQFLEHNMQGRVTVFLTNGVKLEGRLTMQDEHTIYISRDGLTQLVYKHAISTVMPSLEFQMHDIIKEIE